MVLKDLLIADNIKKHSYIVKEDDQNIYKALSQYESCLLHKSKALTDTNAKIKEEICKILNGNNGENVEKIYVIPTDESIRNEFVNEKSMHYKKVQTIESFKEAIELVYLDSLMVNKIYIVINTEFLESISEALLDEDKSKYEYHPVCILSIIEKIILIRNNGLTNIVFNFEDDKNFSTDLEVALNLVIQKCKKIITKKYEVIIAREHERLDLLKNV